MLGLYTVWVIVLFGAQVAYAFQNRALYLQEKLAENVNQRGREFVALRLMTCIGQRLPARAAARDAFSEISAELGIPSKLVQQVLQTLIWPRISSSRSRARNQAIRPHGRWRPSTPSHSAGDARDARSGTGHAR